MQAGPLGWFRNCARKLAARRRCAGSRPRAVRRSGGISTLAARRGPFAAEPVDLLHSKRSRTGEAEIALERSQIGSRRRGRRPVKIRSRRCSPRRSASQSSLRPRPVCSTRSMYRSGERSFCQRRPTARSRSAACEDCCSQCLMQLKTDRWRRDPGDSDRQRASWSPAREAGQAPQPTAAYSRPRQ